MRVATYQEESNTTDLVARLYQVPQSGKLSRLLTLSAAETAGLVKKAEAALREANPRLSDLKRLPRGTLLVVPAVDGLQQTVSVQLLNLARRNTLKVMAQAVAGAQTALHTALQDRLNQAKAAQNVLTSDAVKPLQQLAGFPGVLEAMKKRAAADVSAAKQLLKTQEQGSPRLVKDLEDRVKAIS
jgi:hypothetical protein